MVEKLNPEGVQYEYTSETLKGLNEIVTFMTFNPFRVIKKTNCLTTIRMAFGAIHIQSLRD